MAEENNQETTSRYDILHKLEGDKPLKFKDRLGPLEGKQVRKPYTIARDKPGKTTYAREFDRVKPLDSQGRILYGYKWELMHILPIEEYIELGNKYKKNGGFFEIVEARAEEAFLKNDKSYINYEYILYWFAEDLELSSGLRMNELKFLLEMGGIDFFIHEYFETVDMPKNGDLVVYEDSSGKIHHAGIYRSGVGFPYGGVIQSLVPYFDEAGIFQHDVFFTPYSFGTIAKFYRIKQVCPYYAIVELWKNEKEKFKQMYTVDDDGVYHFNKTEQNIALRDTIRDMPKGEKLIKEFPEIMSLSHVNAYGVCATYALKNVLKSSKALVPFVGIGRLNKILDKYFVLQKKPEIGDLVVYYLTEDSEPVHYGIYYTEEIVESKWGTSSVYRHPIFYVPDFYGDIVKFFKVKDEYTLEEVVEKLEQFEYR